MPGKGTKATSKKKRRVAVKDLPTAKKNVGSKQMKTVKGGVVLCRSSQGGIIVCKTNQGGFVLCKNQGGIIFCKTKQG